MPTYYYCELCGRSFRTYLGLRNHIERQHEISLHTYYFMKNSHRAIAVRRLNTKMPSVFRTFERLLLNSRITTLFRFCNESDAFLWERYGCFRVKCSKYHRMSMAIVPTLPFMTFHTGFGRKYFHYPMSPSINRRGFVLVVDAKALVDDDVRIYPAIYGVPEPKPDEVREFVSVLKWRYVHLEEWFMFYETEVFTVQDVMPEHVKEVWVFPEVSDAAYEALRRVFGSDKLVCIEERGFVRRITPYLSVIQRLLLPISRADKETMLNNSMYRGLVLRYNKLVFTWLTKVLCQEPEVDDWRRCVLVPNNVELSEKVLDVYAFSRPI